MNRFPLNRKEIDLRKEISNTIDGSLIEIAKGYSVLIRRRKTVDDKYIRCVCNKRGEGSINVTCQYCLGEGYYWDEHWEKTFKQDVGSESANSRRHRQESAGFVETELTRFYFKHDANILERDRIVELIKDNEGYNIEPPQRGIIWRINELTEFRSDYGRLEYKIAFCSKSNAIHLDAKRPQL